MNFGDSVESVGKVIDGAGVAAVVIGGLIATAIFVTQLFRGGSLDPTYRTYRRSLGRAILLGLEFLVAGDIIRTVAVSPTFTSTGILAVIVVIRTFLSFSLELELTGRWPWQSKEQPADVAQPATAAGAPSLRQRAEPAS